jgi:hypothetical protein
MSFELASNKRPSSSAPTSIIPPPIQNLPTTPFSLTLTESNPSKDFKIDFRKILSAATRIKIRVIRGKEHQLKQKAGHHQVTPCLCGFLEERI